MLNRLRYAAAARRSRWEAICLRCGQCCYEKNVRGLSVVTDYKRPCAFLDTRTHLCTVYDERFTACPNCRKMTVRHALFVRWLPERCGYVRHFRRREV
jgi:uncharacterized protein